MSTVNIKSSTARPDGVTATDKRGEDPLLGCLIMLTELFGQPATVNTLTAGLPLVDNRLTPELFLRAAGRAGLSARIRERPLGDISDLLLPAVLLLNSGQACILERRLPDGKLRILLPDAGGVQDVPAATLVVDYSGRAIFVKPVYRHDARTQDHGVIRPQHWFWDTILASWPIYGEVLVASFLINLFAIASPLFVMNVYDRVVPNHAVETLWVLAIGITIVYGFDLLMRILRGYFLDIAGKRTDVLLSTTLYERVLGAKLSSRPSSVGAFANSLTEFESFRDFFTSASLSALIDLPFVFLFIVVIALLGGTLALVPLVILPLSLVSGYIAQARLGGVIQELFKHGAQKNAALIETLTGLETIKSMGAEGPAQKRWEQAVGHLSKLGLRARYLSAGAVNITNFLQQFATVVVVIVGVYKITNGDLTVGALIACTLLTGRALAPLGQVAGTLTRIHQARASLATINRLMALPMERPEDKTFVHRPRINGAIEFRDVTFNYPNQSVQALNNLSFRIEPGERVALIGRIGSGKSTIEKLILGLYEPSDGAVMIDGTDLRQIDPADLRHNIGYVPQDVMLFYGNVKTNIMMSAPYADDAAVLRAAEIAGVTDFVNRHPAGFDLEVGERGEGLSGGQRQAVAVARALLLDAPIVIMDEPSNAMDNNTEEAFKRKLEDWLGQRTLVLVTHRASLLTLVQRIIVIDGGRVVADGPKEQVLEALKHGQIPVTRA